MKRIYSDFKDIPISGKIVIIGFIFLIVSSVNDTKSLYFDNTNACKVIKEFVECPLPEREKLTIKALNNHKIGVFSINVRVNDQNREFEKVLLNYLNEKKYVKSQERYSKSKVRDLYSNNYNIIRVERFNNDCMLEIDANQDLVKR